jgi:hypothetical protein
MTITSAAVFDRVLNVLGANAGAVHNIDAELLDVLQDISMRGDFLPGSSASLVTTGGTVAVDVSSLMVRRIANVWISGNYHLKQGYQSEYLDGIELSSSPATGVPQKWFYLNNTLYVYAPVPAAAYTLRIEYYKFHAATTATIEYPDRFRKAIVCGVLSELWGGVLRQVVADKNFVQLEQNKYQSDYDREVALLRSSIPTEVSDVEYKDA